MKVSKDFGIVIRRDALVKKSIDLSSVMREFNFSKNYDDSSEFVSLGPFYGGDNADDCMRSLEGQGLAYIDDFFILEGYFPDWCRVEVFGVDSI
ncbi:MAG: hypothetical protein ABL923_10750 [Burkholderiaceae bacterium]